MPLSVERIPGIPFLCFSFDPSCGIHTIPLANFHINHKNDAVMNKDLKLQRKKLCNWFYLLSNKNHL